MDDPEISQKNSDTIIFVFVFFLLIFIGGLSWFIYEIVNYFACSGAESVSCAVFYCPDQKNGASGTKCYDISAPSTETTNNRVPWRYDENGNLMCQGVQYVNYVDYPYIPSQYG